jgi:RNA polymerase sigma-70 factor (ECF subfamily)
VVQETFFRAYRDLGRFDGRTRFYSWLCGICVNVCYDFGKRRRRAWEREQPLSEDGGDRLAGSGPNAEEGLVVAQEEARVRGCLGRIPETLRAALLLRYQEDLSLQEVADQLRIGLSAAKMRVQRGLALMKECMSRSLAGGAE